MTSDEFKAKGNAAFQAGRNEEAVNWFTSAIDLDPSNHVLYSNRSAAYCALERYPKALEDAVRTVELKPDWAKGWSRKGAALQGLGKLSEAAEAFEKGLQIDPNNEALKKGLVETQRKGSAGGNPFGQIFGPDVWIKIRMNPKLAPYLDQPDYCNMITALQKNPQMANMFLSDKRVMQTFACLCGLNADMPEFDEGQENSKPKPAASSTPKPSETPEEVEKRERKAKADAEKDKGNAHYKKKEFAEALAQYDAALALAPEFAIYLVNKAAVYYEMGELEECVKHCDEALERARTHRNEGSVIAKALARKGTAFMKAKRYEEAIATFKASLVEHRMADTLTKLQQAEAAKKVADEEAYFDEGKALEAKERGNEFWKKNLYPEALKEYEEAIKRNPKDPTFYSNRAACYMKLGELSYAQKDCDKALELNPDFVKCMTRKAQIHFLAKEYHKALQWYEKALKLEPQNPELRSGVERTLKQINSHTGEVDEERARRGMADPEIQALLQDPMLHMVLRDFSENPAAAQKHLRDPVMGAKIQKLIAAGVLRTG
eukprot:NODE_903_length_1835_cov_160.438410_g796_i0.p1 GENE.NODE_903_length_1835_cov_160.438410_g796_i0~~NODE_903_length_1835_cov_160.438410_g796_i0.p1  ORF type:complete len:547 (-),score=118.08 NODE_903_length_1835_cov_160.438410_g796_i0:125-1765(-)